MNCLWNQRQIDLAQITLISQLSIPVIQFYCSIFSDHCFLTTHMINFHPLGELMNLALQGLKIYLLVFVYAYTCTLLLKDSVLIISPVNTFAVSSPRRSTCCVLYGWSVRRLGNSGPGIEVTGAYIYRHHTRRKILSNTILFMNETAGGIQQHGTAWENNSQTILKIFHLLVTCLFEWEKTITLPVIYLFYVIMSRISVDAHFIISYRPTVHELLARLDDDNEVRRACSQLFSATTQTQLFAWRRILRQRVFRGNNVDFADISRFKCPALIRAKPNSHKILQSHTFIITLHGYMYNSLQYHNRILKFSLFNTKGLFPDPPNPQKLTKTRRNYSATSHWSSEHKQIKIFYHREYLLPH